MKLYHQTTSIRYEKGIKSHGLIPGGVELDLTEDEMYDEEFERAYAGAVYCTDSSEVICLALIPDGRYGSVTLEIDSKDLDLDAIIVFDDDAWTSGSKRIAWNE